MKRGVLIFAINNGTINYQKIAAWSARRIQAHLDLPVTLVTDPKSAPSSRYFEDFDQVVDWHNTDRVTAYDVSPYEETLLLDADYVVNSNTLLTLFDSNEDLLCHRRAFDVTGLTDYQHLNSFGRHHMPMAWATVMFFRRSEYAKAVFSMMSMVRDHWVHYRDLYRLDRSPYRNDYALAIALNTLNGHLGKWKSIPWNLASIDPRHSVKQINEGKFQVNFKTSDGKPRYVELHHQDFHAMCKKSLEETIEDNA